MSADPESNATASEGAQLFATHCAGCHTISAAGSQGSGNRALRTQGPNFDQRVESYDEALFAIRNGGFSGAIMPQNILVGDDAAKVAEFLAKYSGTDVDEAARPTAAPSSETGEADASPNEVAGTDNQTSESPGSGSGSGGQDSGKSGQDSGKSGQGKSSNDG